MEQMTAEQAISLLGNIAGWDIDRGERGNEKREAIQLAIDALEKQVPKKPTDRVKFKFDVVDGGICPGYKGGYSALTCCRCSSVKRHGDIVRWAMDKALENWNEQNGGREHGST